MTAANESGAQPTPGSHHRSRSAVAAWTRAGLVVINLLSTGAAGPARANDCIPLRTGVPESRLAAMSRGFNADGWINGPKSAPPAPEVLRQLRKSGMSHVRLPVPAELIMRRFASQEQRDETLRSLDQALRQLTSLGYATSVDLHPGERFNQLHRDDPAASRQQIEGAWHDLAGVMASYSPDLVFAELLNEPDLDAARWQSESEALAVFVRRLLPETTLIVGPVSWQRADSLPNLHPLSDDNVVYAIHFYDPMIFTHQGHWDARDPLSQIRGLPFPIRSDDPQVQMLRGRLQSEKATAPLAMLDRAIEISRTRPGIETWLEPAVAWQKTYARPIIINEFGVLKGGAPRESRLRWLSSVTSFARAHCWGWVHWELAQGFGLLDDSTGKPDDGAMRGLMSQ